MLTVEASPKHYTATLSDGEVVRSNVPWKVTQAEAGSNFELAVAFIDGTVGRVEMR